MKDAFIERKAELFDDSTKDFFFFLGYIAPVCNITIQGNGKDQPAFVVFTVV